MTNTGAGSQFSGLKASLRMETATFQFAYAGNMDGYHIDLSTVPDMSTDVYLSFAVGHGSPLVQTNPRQWDKYHIGKKLYWRVTNFERTVSGPIMTAVVAP